MNQPQHLPELTRAQLDIIRDRVECGADPQALSHWLARVTDIGEDVRTQVQAAGEDFQSGGGHRWYAAVLHDTSSVAAGIPADPPTGARLPSQHHDRD
ncbi:hypothetical protein ACQ856_29165 (plasmid) [Mycolicibacterium psychrotolerans]|uniref:hypothetical protein n=1 Tax=Mycolicibacterium psychrotolerans TaxID=216929 RepID=UPI003D67E603